MAQAFAGKRTSPWCETPRQQLFRRLLKGHAKEAAAAAGGYELIPRDQGDGEEQIAVIDALIAQKVDGIIVSGMTQCARSRRQEGYDRA